MADQKEKENTHSVLKIIKAAVEAVQKGDGKPSTNPADQRFFAELLRSAEKKPKFPKEIQKLVDPKERLAKLAELTVETKAKDALVRSARIVETAKGQSVITQLVAQIQELKDLPDTHDVRLARMEISANVFRAAKEMDFDQTKGTQLAREMGMVETSARRANPPPRQASREAIIIDPAAVGVNGNDARVLLESLGRVVSGGIVQDPQVAHDMARRINDELMRGRIGGSDADILRSLSERMRSMEFEQPFSTFHLSKAETREMIKNPAAFFERKLREIERSVGDPNTSIVRGALQRLEVAGGLYSDESYDRNRGMITFDEDVDEDLKRQLFEQARVMGAEKRQLAQYVTARIDGVFAVNDLMRVGDLKKFTDRMKMMGDRGVNLIDASDGGLVGEWRGRYESILSDIVTKNKKRIMPADEDIARHETIRQLLAEKNNYTELYRDFFRRFQMPGDNELPEFIMNFNEETAESIVRRAEFTHRLRMRLPVVMERGLGPGEGDWTGDISGYQTLSIEEKMLGAARMRDWFMRKWGNVDIVLRIWNVGAKFTARADHQLHGYIKEQANELWTKLKLAQNTPENVAARRKAVERMAFLIKHNAPPDEVWDLKPPPADPAEYVQWETSIQPWISKLSQRKVLEYVELEEGGFRMQRLLRPYFYMDSLWREGTYQKFVNQAFNHGDKYMLGAKIRQKGEKYFFNPMEHKEHVKGELMAALGEVTRYRPQGMADFLIRGESVPFLDWYRENRATFGTDNPHDFLSLANRRFMMLNGFLMRDNLAPINYGDLDDLLALARLAPDARGARLAALDRDQQALWTHIDRVFGVQIGGLDTPEQYFSAMKLLANRLPTHFEELTHVKYDRFYLSIPWEDDIPIYLLEDLQNMKRVKDDYMRNQRLVVREGGGERVMTIREAIGKVLGISELITAGGVGPGSPLGRAWGDYGMAIECFDAWNENKFHPDEKEYIKMLRLIWDKVAAYQGPYLATEGLIKFTAAWLGAGQVDSKFGDFLTAMGESSEFKKARGGNAPSLSLDKVNEMLENIEQLVGGRFDTKAPHMAHALENFLRLSTLRIGLFDTGVSWHRIAKLPGFKQFFGRYPDVLKTLDRGFKLGLMEYKVSLGAVYILLILGLFAADQAKKGEEQAKH